MLRDFRLDPGTTLIELKKHQKEIQAILKANKNTGTQKSPNIAPENKSRLYLG